MSETYISGTEELAAKLRRLSDVARGSAVREGLMAGGMFVEAQTKINIREHGLIDTGFMLNSVTTQVVSDNEVVVGVGAEYSIYHEFGTSRGLPERPFLGPAVAAHHGEIVDAVRATVAAAIEEAL